jgi:hypothetical protein
VQVVDVRHHRPRRVVFWAVAGAASLILAGAPVHAATDLGSVIDGLRVWAAGLLVALATLFLTIGGIRYLAAAGNPREMQRAKEAMRTAVIGFALAALSPLLIDILRRIVGV